MSKYRLRRILLTAGTRKAVDVLSVLDTDGYGPFWGDRRGKRDDRSNKSTEVIRMGPDVLRRRGGSEAAARGVRRKMQLSPNTSQPRHSGQRGGLFPKSARQYCAMPCR